MHMKEWAEKEVEIACKRENPDKKDGEFDYGCACYESALKAFNSLLEDDHSGCSIEITKHILINLIDGKPLTPIEDTPDVWFDSKHYGNNNFISYQCKRMSSLFKDVYDDGRVRYIDIYRFSAIDINTGISWNSGLITNLGHDLYPITMPYIPESKSYNVFFETLLVDTKNGDFDTKAIFYIITPDGERKDINRYFREPNEGEKTTYHGWVEIDYEEYLERKESAEKIKRKDDII